MLDRAIRTCGPLLVLALLGGSGCKSDVRRKDPSRPGLTTAEDLDFKDYQIAAESLVNSMLVSGVLDREDERRPVLMLSTFRNKTLEHLDLQLLTQKVRIALNKSGKVVTTTAVGLDGPEDPATAVVQEDLHEDPAVNPATVPEYGEVVSPNFSLSGTITQKLTEVGRSRESYFAVHMVLTDLRTGLALWEDEQEIVKEERRGVFGG